MAYIRPGVVIPTEILNDNGIDFEALKLMEKSDMKEMVGLIMGDRIKLWEAMKLDPMLSN